MCGIWATFGGNASLQAQVTEALKVRHRGPDAFRFEGLHGFKTLGMGFSHLAIVGSHLGMQPMRVSQHPHLVLMFNGEIYNYQKIFKTYNIHPESDSDGECILHLYKEGGIEFAASMLDGVFAFCLFDCEKRKIFIGRDTFGVKPLYRYFKDGQLSVCSEYKGLVNLHDVTGKALQYVQPGTVETFKMNIHEAVEFDSCVKFHNFSSKPKWDDLEGNPQLGTDIFENIRTLLTEAVRKRIMTYRRVGCFLSGGLDSSLVTALLVKIAKTEGIKYPIQTFSIGLPGSFDLAAARKVADHLGTEHHEVILSPLTEDFHKLIENVIYHLESYDSCTIPNSIAQYILCEYVRTKTDTVVLMSGEGADEVAQGYQYFFNAPSPEDADAESRHILDTIHSYAVQRVDRMTAAHGLEVRVPFLDHNFVHYYLTIPAHLRCPTDATEKYLIRKAFEDLDLLPADILWRKKAEFGQGVSCEKQSWLTAVRNYSEQMVSDKDWQQNSKRLLQFKDCQANTKSEYFHQLTYQKYFSHSAYLVPKPWTTKWNAINPSLEL